MRFFQLGGLTVDPAKQLVEQKGDFFATETEWEQLINLYRGNPLALKLTACHIQNVFSGNIGEFFKNNSLCFGGIHALAFTPDGQNSLGSFKRVRMGL